MAKGRQGAAYTMLPHDREAEQAVLGAIIHDNRLLVEARALLSEQMFFSPGNREIFKAMLTLQERESPVDEVTLGHYLGERELLPKVGGMVYIAELVDLTPVSSNLRWYAEIVHKHWQARQIIEHAKEIVEGRGDPDQLDRFITGLRDVGKESLVHSARPVKQIVRQLTEQMETGAPVIERIPTYCPDLDQMMAGVPVGFPTIMAARTSEGKSTLAGQTILRCGLMGIPSLYVTLEMYEREITARMVANLGEVDGDLILDHPQQLTEHDWDRVVAAAGAIEEAPIHFAGDGQKMRLGQVESVIRRYVAQHGIRLVAIDHIRLIEVQADNGAQAQTERIVRLHQLAKELDIAMLVMVQINRRGADEKTVPRLEHLEWSSALEQEASAVIVLHRETREQNDAQRNPWRHETPWVRVYVAKNRNGRTGNRPVAFNGAFYRIGSRWDPNTQGRMV